MWRTKGMIYSVRYWYRCVGSEGFHTSIIYGTAGLMYGRYRGLGDILRSYSPSEITRREFAEDGDSPMSTSQHQRNSQPSSEAEPS